MSTGGLHTDPINLTRKEKLTIGLLVIIMATIIGVYFGGEIIPVLLCAIIGVGIADFFMNSPLKRKMIK